MQFNKTMYPTWLLALDLVVTTLWTIALSVAAVFLWQASWNLKQGMKIQFIWPKDRDYQPEEKKD